jgi:hypothetical protein
VAKRNEKKHREKDGSAAIYIDLNKHTIEVQKFDAEAKSRAEDYLIMLVDLSTMDAYHRAWFKKK